MNYLLFDYDADYKTIHFIIYSHSYLSFFNIILLKQKTCIFFQKLRNCISESFKKNTFKKEKKP